MNTCRGKRDRFDIEFRMKHKAGHWVDILSRANAFFDEEGNAVRVVGTHVDITERKKIKKQLADSELRWKFAIEGNKDGLWDWNLKTNEVYFSTRWKKMLGFKEDEISNSLEEWEKRVHPDDKDNVYMDIDAHLKGKTEYYKNEHRVLCKDGTYKWILDRGVVISRDEENNPLRMIGTHTDISERKKAEEEILESQVKFKTIFSILNVGLSITDNNGNIIDCNIASEQILGITKEEHLKRNYSGKEWKIIRTDMTEMPSEEFSSVKAMKEQKTILNVEMGIIRPDGLRWISVNATPLNLPNYGVLIAYVDITTIKENQKQLIELNATKDKFFSIIAHDLRSPYNSMMGFLDLALSEIKENNYENTEEYIILINQTIQKTYNLLTNLLQWSRFKTGVLKFEPQKVMLSEILADVNALLETAIREKQINMQLNIPHAFEVFADKFMLEAILRNLVSNSIKYCSNKGKIIISAKNNQNFSEITVEDDGLGIKKEDIGKLFRIESSFTSPGTNNEEGTGLGLIMCHEFVTRHSGKIVINSKINSGTKISFTLLKGK